VLRSFPNGRRGSTYGFDIELLSLNIFDELSCCVVILPRVNVDAMAHVAIVPNAKLFTHQSPVMFTDPYKPTPPTNSNKLAAPQVTSQLKLCSVK
jgi:hypothetical protein